MSEVRSLQRLLDLDQIDGMFGPGTERAVKRLQKGRGLAQDGIVGPKTWEALGPFVPLSSVDAPAGLGTFHGDLDWVHRWEGHAGKPYWPGGRSGVTLDPGFDLRYQTEESLRRHYSILRTPQLAVLSACLGLRGHAARDHLRGSPETRDESVLRGIRISRATADAIFPHVAVEYWQPITKRFRVLDHPDTPGSVQTAMLSLSYNRGPGNKDLQALVNPLATKNWIWLAEVIGGMQQDHPLPGIRQRRRAESELILCEVEMGETV